MKLLLSKLVWAPALVAALAWLIVPPSELGIQQSRRLYPVVNNDNRTGFIDRTGRFVIPFDRLPKETFLAWDFHDGRAVIYLKRDKQKSAETGSNYDVGYIDETGKIVIPTRFDQGRDFSEGLAYVSGDGVSAFINTKGEPVVRLATNEKPGLEEFNYGFHEGLAAIMVDDSVAFVDHSGKLLRTKYSNLAYFSGGLAAVVVGAYSEQKYGFIDTKGELIIEPRFKPSMSHHWRVEALSRFSEGLASVRVNDLYGYINRRGAFVIQPQFVVAGDFSDGRAFVKIKEKGGGYVDKSGRWLIGPSSEIVAGGKFREGLAPVKFDPAGWGYLDTTGKVVIRPQFSKALEFVDGVAAAYTGRALYAPYESGWSYSLAAHWRIGSLSRFAEGLASVRLGKNYGFIDKTGAFVIQPQFAFAGNFSEGLAFVKLGRQGGYIDHDGHWVIGPSEDYLNGRELREGTAAVNFDQGWGYIDRAGKIIIAPRFPQAFEFIGGVAVIGFFTEFRYINTKGEYLVPRVDSGNAQRKTTPLRKERD